ncbi:hypothetical protein NBH00_10740 [Paraconexibacter antarcticus]|uniref:FtsX-like permease family protein n=1 Tax=Paraconexibacter antarcticus TaxID=2949664 RepID=A0ABY5DZL9_9ACTN|nr:hypothetical protein [Paraconexibacter antarcticus]UTI66661.1 hypothetical protein NBH00_10740 [Paraconexibacter antarcticus]
MPRTPALAAPLRLAAARLRARPGRWLGVAAVTAVMLAFLGTVAGYGTLTGDRAAHRTLAAVPPPARTVALTWSGGVTRAVDARARAAVRAMAGAAPTRTTQLLPLRLARATVRLAAVRPLGRWVTVTAGRLPQGCVPARCEVLQVGGVPAPARVRDRGLRVVVVGRGRLRSPVPLGYLPRAARAVGGAADEQRPPVLVGADPAALDALAGLASVFRTQQWAAPLDLGALRAWDLGPVRARIAARARDAAVADPGLTATAPLGALAAARARAAAVPGRLETLTAAALAVLAAVLLLTAGGLRAGLAAEGARLERAGARLGQRAALLLGEAGGPALAGAAAGVLAAVAAVALLGARDGVGAGPLLAHGLARGPVLAGGAAAALAAVALAVAGAAAGARLAARLCELALAGAGAALVLALADARVRDGADRQVLELPALVLTVGGLLVARATPPALALLGRRWPGAPGRPGRLAVLDLARRPGPAALAVAAVAVAAALTVLAGGYRATLRAGQSDQAAFRVPLGGIVGPDAALRGPLDRRPLARYRAVPGVTAVSPVLRRDAAALIGPTRDPLTLLAAPAAVLAQAGLPHARRLRQPAAAVLGAARVAPGTPLAVRIHSRGDAADVGVVLRRADGTSTVADLTPARADPARRVGRVPPGPAALRVAGLTLTKAEALAATDGHQATNDLEGALVSRGRATLGPLRDGRGRTLTRFAGWGAHGAAAGLHAGVVRYAFDRSGLGVLRPPATVDRAPVPVLTDAGTARDAGARRRVVLAVDGAEVPALVVGVAPRVATVTGAFAVADAAALRTALDALAPGTGRVDELWVAGAGGPALAAALHRVAGGSVLTRAAVRARLTRDPLARGRLRALAGAAALAVALALLALVAARGAILRDGAAAHAGLEADGVAPRVLRRVVALQAGGLAVAGVVAGVALGLAAGATGAAVVRGGDAVAQPPLRTVVPVGATLGLTAVALLLTALVAALLAGRCLRGDWPARVLSEEVR